MVSRLFLIYVVVELVGGIEPARSLMLEALAINVGLLAAGGACFLALLSSARKAGSLLQMGE